MSWLDLLILAVILVSLVVGVVRGLIKEALTLLSWVTAGWLAWRFHPWLMPHFSAWIEQPSLRVLAAVLVIFILSLVLLTALSFLLTKLIGHAGLSGLNRSLGGLFGIARGALAISLLVMLATLTPVIHEQWWLDSYAVPYFMTLTEWLRQWLPTGITTGLVAPV
ncbi:MAG: CvpA family protein [Gammaproteobacteria bacterium]|nr:CvpA family protein [Gammaproteobacteria bacterium]